MQKLILLCLLVIAVSAIRPSLRRTLDEEELHRMKRDASSSSEEKEKAKADKPEVAEPEGSGEHEESSRVVREAAVDEPEGSGEAASAVDAQES